MQPSPELQDLTRRIAQAVGDGDVAFLERHISRQAEVAFLGTDPDEWWTDLAVLNRALAAQREAGVMVIPGDPLAYQEGNVTGPLIGRSGSALATRKRRSDSAWSTDAKTARGRWSTFTVRSGSRTSR